MKITRKSSLQQVRKSLARSVGGPARWRMRNEVRKGSIPVVAVEQCIGGLLFYYSAPAPRRELGRVHYDVLARYIADWLLDSVRHHNDAIMATVRYLISSVSRHPSPLILQHESNYLSQQVADYGELRRSSKEERRR